MEIVLIFQSELWIFQSALSVNGNSYFDWNYSETEKTMVNKNNYFIIIDYFRLQFLYTYDFADLLLQKQWSEIERICFTR